MSSAPGSSEATGPKAFDKAFFDKMSSTYRASCISVPGLSTMHLLLRSFFETKLSDEAHVLVCACGGGAEVDTLAASDRRLRFTGFDTSAAMLAAAQAAAVQAGAADRCTFIEGTIDAISEEPKFDAATALLIAHFFSDEDGTKLKFLKDIRRRLRPGAPVAFLDTSTTDDEMRRLGPVWIQHAQLVGGATLKEQVATMLPKISAPSLARVTPARFEALLLEAGFTNVTQCFRGLWYVGYFAEADESSAV